eukprot:11183737-Lingulodinium_polyedra.AAC.1
MPPSMGGAKQRAARERSRSPTARSSNQPAQTPSGRGGARQRALERVLPQDDAPGDAAAGGEDFKQHIANLFLKNKFSAPETVALLKAASRAGAAGVSSLSRAGGGGKHLKNASRDLTSAFLRGAAMPPLYWA